MRKQGGCSAQKGNAGLKVRMRCEDEEARKAALLRGGECRVDKPCLGQQAALTSGYASSRLLQQCARDT
eukprot:scaffold16581_cov24-Tisochrysis_lutea.AAC.1